MSMDGDYYKIKVNLEEVMPKEKIEEIQNNRLIRLKEIHGDRRIKELIDMGIFTFAPEVKFDYQYICDPGNCGAVYIYNGCISLFSDVTELEKLPIQTNKIIATEISKRIVKQAEGLQRSLIHCTDVIYLFEGKSKDFPTRFMYLAAFAPEYWTVNTAGAVNNANYTSAMKAITNLTCRDPEKHTNHCETSIVKMRENPYLKNANITK